MASFDSRDEFPHNSGESNGNVDRSWLRL